MISMTYRLESMGYTICAKITGQKKTKKKNQKKSGEKFAKVS